MKSKLAIASFILGSINLASFLFYILSFVVISLAPSPFLILISLLFYLSIIGAPVGLVLGIVSIFSIRKNKLEGKKYAVMGIVFCSIGILIILLFIIALAGLGSVIN